MDFETEAAAVRDKIERLTATATKPLTRPAQIKIDRQLRALIADLEEALGKIDPIAMPGSIFDPSNPKVIGRFIALALVAQSRHPLEEIGRFYGSGVYAIYYKGDFPLYAAISGTETPVYVGQAAPSIPGARTAREQGPRLAARLNEHRKNIAKAVTTLKLTDFEVRYLVVQSGWETAAEDYLIHLFSPLWNSETDILYGLGKHGDAATTRANKRSPWDTLHPGRKWAIDSKEDGRAVSRINADVHQHLATSPPFTNREALLDAFFAELNQG